MNFSPENPTPPDRRTPAVREGYMPYADFVAGFSEHHNLDISAYVTPEIYNTVSHEELDTYIESAKSAVSQTTRQNKEKALTRRAFLGKSFIAAAGVITADILTTDEKKEHMPTQWRRVTEYEEEHENKEKPALSAEEQIAVHGKIIDVEDAKDAYFLLRLKEFAPGSSGFERLVKGLTAQQKWMDQIEEGAAKYGIKKERLWAIGAAESYLENDAVSESSATGAWQIMSGTATRSMKNVGEPLVVTPTYDQRRDPVYASRGAAALLQANDTFFAGNQDLGNVGYNQWPLAKDFAVECREKNIKPKYIDYNTWLAHKINADLAELEECSDDNQVVREKQVALFKQRYWQNFDYPEKVMAIEAVLHDFDMLDAVRAQPITYREIPVPENRTTVFHHVLTPGEGLTHAARAIIAQAQKKKPHITLSLPVVIQILCSTNAVTKNDILQPGKRLDAQIALSEPKTPRTIAVEAGLDPTTFIRYNPSITDISAPLPHGIKIRLPADTNHRNA